MSWRFVENSAGNGFERWHWAADAWQRNRASPPLVGGAHGAAQAVVAERNVVAVLCDDRPDLARPFLRDRVGTVGINYSGLPGGMIVDV